MRKKLLICNNDPGIGKIIKKSFNEAQYTVYNCSMHYRDLDMYLNNKRRVKYGKKDRYYDTVVFFVGEHMEDTANMVWRLREEYKQKEKDLDIFVVMMYKWERNEERFYIEGASMCLWFQETPAWMLANYIKLFLYRREFKDVDRPLSNFLAAHGFSNFYNGFRIFCHLLSLLLKEPERWNIDMQDNYKYIAVKYGDGKDLNVKRILENYCDSIYKSPYIDPLLKVRFKRKPQLIKFIQWTYDIINESS